MSVIAAAVAVTTAIAASAPAFAWGGGAPTNSYDQAAHGNSYSYYGVR